MLRRVMIVVAAAIAAGTIWLSRGCWLAALERDARIGKEFILSDPIDVSHKGSFTWSIPRATWSYEEGSASLELYCRRPVKESRALPHRGDLQLRIVVQAYGETDSGGRYDRLIRNWYYKSDDPLAPDAGLCESFSRDEVEFCLGGVSIYPFEKTTVTVEVTSPDPSLAAFEPRLRLVGDHDYAVYEHLPFLRTLRDTGLVLSSAMVLMLAAIAWRGIGHGRRDT